MLFVLLWSTGFIGAKYGLPYAEPFTLLFLRFVLALLLLAPLVWWLRPAMAMSWIERGHLMVSGLLLHGAYLGGVYVAIKLELSAGMTALIVGAQPVLTSLAAPLLFGERPRLAHWAGLALGFAGIYLILGGGAEAHAAPAALLAAIAALFGITVGTLYQKRFCAQHDLLAVTVHQYLPTVALFGLGALLFETREVEWTAQFVAALLWLVFALSLGAMLLLTWLIKHGEASKVSSLFYLVPPVTAVMAWLLFDEPLGWLKVAGIALVALGVWLVMRRQPASAGVAEQA
ncbi:DMT family transporter [Betaproteobacteria bacterium SCN2]|jgi:drug/metabolite transporter (DMT)-like permease|nr:DMT family transporter [Betaproteobacteria bacterium SCN2]